jgi:hypothetical protein
MSSTVKRIEDERALTGTGKYTIKHQHNYEVDDEEYSDNYSDDFEEDSDGGIEDES